MVVVVEGREGECSRSPEIKFYNGTVAFDSGALIAGLMLSVLIEHAIAIFTLNSRARIEYSTTRTFMSIQFHCNCAWNLL